MKKRLDTWNKIVLAIGLAFTSLTACSPKEEFSQTPYGNFDALWTILDERYCFFAYKNIDWDEIYTTYRARLDDKMSDKELFGVLAEMLDELQDGHVNLSSAFDVTRYWDWFENYPSNFDRDLVMENYLHQPDYQIASSLYYRMLDDCNIGYIYYESFSDPIGDGNLDEVLLAFSSCDGLIIDVRDNGGGQLSTVQKLAARFTTSDFTSGYIQHKTGPGHNDFSDLYPITQESADATRMHFAKPVAILTNRKCYSATNDFVSVMGNLPQVCIIGDRTGGGSGLPFSSELPNGWVVRFSASPIYNTQKEHTEFGIEPDIHARLTAEDTEKGIDTIIERAKTWILTRQ